MQETRVCSLGQEDPLGKETATTPVFLPGKSHGQRSLAGDSPWGCKRCRCNLATKQHEVPPWWMVSDCFLRVLLSYFSGWKALPLSNLWTRFTQKYRWLYVFPIRWNASSWRHLISLSLWSTPWPLALPHHGSYSEPALCVCGVTMSRQSRGGESQQEAWASTPELSDSPVNHHVEDSVSYQYDSS